MMQDFDLMELAPEQQEDLAYLHQQLFSTATEVVQAGGGEPAVIITETTTTNVDMVHDVIDFTGKYGNGNTAPETAENDKPAAPAIAAAPVYHGEGEALVGRSIVKKFKRTKYAGKVIGFDAECKWYKVEYEDGDEEELEYKELEGLLVEAGEAEAVRAANAKKKLQPETDSDTKSPGKRGRGRPAGVKTPAKPKAEKKASTPKSPKAPKSPKVATPKKASPKKAEDGKTEEKTPASGEKRGRGRPKKDGSAGPSPKAPKAADGKASADSSTESKPSTRKAAATSETRTGRSPRGKAAAASSASQKEAHQLIGAKTKKDFNGTLYDGEVVGYDPKNEFYKVMYSDGDKEDLTLKEVRATLVEGLATPKTRGRSKSADPATKSEESPPKKQKKESTPKKDTPAKAQSPARDGSQPRKRGRPAKAKR